MSAKSILLVASGILHAIGFIPYIRSILRREGTEPAKATWIVWAAIDTVTALGMIASKSLNGLMVGSLVGVFVVMVLAIRYGTPGWTKLDKICLGGGFLGLVLWYFSGNPTTAIVCGLGSLTLGAIPTIASAWCNPVKENRWAWMIFWLSGVLATLAIPRWDANNALQPLTYLVVDGLITGIVWLRPRLQPVVS